MDFAIEFVVGVLFWVVGFRVARRIRWRAVAKHGK